MPSLSLAEFFGDLAAISAKAYIDSNTSADEAGSGELNRSSYGTRLWYGSVTIKRLRHDAADALAAKVQYLEEADVTFRVFRSEDKEKAITTGTVDAIAADRRLVTLSEARSDGEVFGIAFSSGKLSMHRIVTVDGLVHTVVPALPFGVAVSDVATFGRPEIEAVLTQAQHPSVKRFRADSYSFSWIQTY